MFQNGVFIVDIHSAVDLTFFAQRGVGKGFEIRLFTVVRHVQAVHDVLTVEVIAQVNADGEIVEQREADILIFATGELVINLLI